ncbi:MAG: YeeE/YedE family protein [Marinilabiliales bacterium]|nr:YeeE/YedE family protein [Marinilabiliales bacterium]
MPASSWVALAGAGLSGRIRLEPKPPGQVVTAALGGFLVGVGAGFASGCVVGNIISGWALMSVGMFLFGFAVILGELAGDIFLFDERHPGRIAGDVSVDFQTALRIGQTPRRRRTMKTIPINVPFAPVAAGPKVDVVLDEKRIKVRRIDLAAGAEIPRAKCRRTSFLSFFPAGSLLPPNPRPKPSNAPGAVYIPGGHATRSMKAESAARVLAVLCRAGDGAESGG